MRNPSMEAEPIHVVVVDDDPAVRDILRSCFEGESYRVSEADGGPELFAVLDKVPVHLITLDLSLPGEDGLAIARQIRSRSSVPIIMVTGKGDPVDHVVGLEIGADDYISKPFHVREILARVRSVLRRARDRPGSRIGDQVLGEKLAFAGWVLNCVSRELRSPIGAICPLTTTEFNLLEVFVRRPNRALSRDQLLDLAKGPDWSANDRAIDNQVGRLRRKMMASENAGELIKSVRSVGYILAANVTRLS